MPARADVLVLDVNETLSDLSGLRSRLADIGAPPELLELWFAATLRDGIGLSAAGAYAEFADVATAALVALLCENGRSRDRATQAAGTVVGGMGDLDLHRDVREGLRRLHDQGLRLVTLTNGSTDVTEQLLSRGGVLDLIEQRLSVAEVRRWKPAPEPYRHAVARCEVRRERAMLVAVHPWDVDGAKRAGLGAAWINRQDLPYPSVLTPPDLEARDFLALSEAF